MWGLESSAPLTSTLFKDQLYFVQLKNKTKQKHNPRFPLAFKFQFFKMCLFPELNTVRDLHCAATLWWSVVRLACLLQKRRVCVYLLAPCPNIYFGFMTSSGHSIQWSWFYQVLSQLWKQKLCDLSSSKHACPSSPQLLGNPRSPLCLWTWLRQSPGISGSHSICSSVAGHVCHFK